MVIVSSSKWRRFSCTTDYIAHNISGITKVLHNETGKPTETHFVYPSSLKDNARLVAFRNFLFSKVNEWKF